jgi:sugar lactone lactonase YvrE
VQSLQEALTELLAEHMTPELCSSLIVDCEVLLVDDLDEMLERYVLKNFADCVKTEQFGSWPLHRMIGLLRSDDLIVENEEEVLSAVLHWHRSAPGRDDATAALLQMVRFPLLSAASLQALRSREGLSGLPGVVVSRLAAAAMKCHQGSGREGLPGSPTGTQLRHAFPRWWADFGCSIRGGTVVAERGVEGAEGELEPWAVHVYSGSLFIIDGREPCCVLQWPLGADCGRVIVGTGSTLNGVNDFSDIIDVAIDSSGDLYVLDGQHGRIVRIRDGVGEVVGDGRLVLDGTRALYIALDGAVYFIDEGGSRVQRFADGKTTVVAGGPEAGSGTDQLEDAEDIFVICDGTIYISDSGNHRIQKWAPGSTRGVTVAGGNGKGNRLDQLDHPVGLCVTEDATIYVADYHNHRIMKWREGCACGLIVAGDPDAVCGRSLADNDQDRDQDRSGFHQLCEPIDVTIDASGALYVADNGNARVVRWAAPCQAYERVLSPF